MTTMKRPRSGSFKRVRRFAQGFPLVGVRASARDQDGPVLAPHVAAADPVRAGADALIA